LSLNTSEYCPFSDYNSTAGSLLIQFDLRESLNINLQLPICFSTSIAGKKQTKKTAHLKVRIRLKTNIYFFLSLFQTLAYRQCA